MTEKKTYLELLQFDSFNERLDFLLLHGNVGEDTFGFSRYLNQSFYKSTEWRKIRDKIIIRDNGCDLGVAGYEIYDRILIHHINPITKQDILDRNPIVFDPNNLICVSKKTHDAIHYSNGGIVYPELTIRTPGDTRLW